MQVLVVLAAFVVAVSAQYGPAEYRDAPIPYSYNYVADGEEGSSSHQETGNGNGRVQGSYSLSDIDGRSRVVEYIADEGGFRAVVRTNEQGTANQNPADVVMESSAPDASAYSSYGGGAVSQPRPAPRPAVSAGGGRQGGGAGTRFVLVPIDDPRARGYY